MPKTFAVNMLMKINLSVPTKGNCIIISANGNNQRKKSLTYITLETQKRKLILINFQYRQGRYDYNLIDLY